jgi:acetoacetyl-CoA synthetase
VRTTDTTTNEPELLYLPPRATISGSRIQAYLEWVNQRYGLEHSSYDDLHEWSVTELSAFWQSIWDYFGVRSHAQPAAALVEKTMPDARWFPGATLNYAEHCFGTSEDASATAVVAYSQTRGRIDLTFEELADEVRRARSGLRQLGVGRGDRVVAYLPNCPEALVAFLATASLGAVWASCAPEFGPASVIDRFGQIDPTILLTVAGYTYGATEVDRRDAVAEIRAGLGTLKHVVHVPYGPHGLSDIVSWNALVAPTAEPMRYEAVAFDHPLYVLFSSGTTGKPKAIVHGHGGILLEHLKNHGLHWDLGPGDRLLWFTTTAWMMWNTLVSALLVRASIVMIDGNPLYPDLREQWRLAEQSGATLVGASPSYLMACRKQDVHPAREFDLSRLRQIGAAGSPFPADGFRWIAGEFGDGVLLNVGSGGTDVCTGLVQGSPLQPVWAGEMSGASLGVDVKAFDEHGTVVVGEVGELVITSPMPSMPVRFWGDDDGDRLRATYFEQYPGVFRFGDWCRFSRVGSCLIMGRSDATLNRGGVRLGTAEFYSALQDVDEVLDSVVVHLESDDGGPGELILFVKLGDGAQLDGRLEKALGVRLRQELSPRHVPDTVVEVPSIPYGRTGKKLEVPIKKILRGASLSDVASPGALADPSSLDAFVAYARGRAVNRT